MLRGPPGSTRTDTLFPYTTLFRSTAQAGVAGRGRAFLRPSGTEPVVRVTVEADDDALAQSTLEALVRSEEHTSELQSLMRISYAVFCLKKKITRHTYPS